jgi:transcription elongation factor GreA
MSQVSYYTPEGLQKLKDELYDLKTVQRPAISEQIAEARDKGDLSENAEYDAAKEKQAFIEGRIKEVESKLAGAQIIDPSLIDADGKVVFGATVELENLEDASKMTYQIVGDDEADLEANKISISSPIARALIRKEAGDVVKVTTPGGDREVEIISVQYI